MQLNWNDPDPMSLPPFTGFPFPGTIPPQASNTDKPVGGIVKLHGDVDERISTDMNNFYASVITSPSKEGSQFDSSPKKSDKRASDDSYHDSLAKRQKQSNEKESSQSNNQDLLNQQLIQLLSSAGQLSVNQAIGNILSSSAVPISYYLNQRAAGNTGALASIGQSGLSPMNGMSNWGSSSLADLDAILRAQYAQQLTSRLHGMTGSHVGGTASSGFANQQNLAALLMQWPGLSSNSHHSNIQAPIMPSENAFVATMVNSSENFQGGLPPCNESRLPPYTNRPKFPLGIDEDPNWLSGFHCFVRAEIVEVFRASHEDCKSRNNSIQYQQVGVRCRFCAHVSPSARAGRSSAYPSSLRQIYQSFTMMLRDHFGNCDFMPSTVRAKFLELKDTPSQGATDSKRYWVYSAVKIGMVDSSDGISITEQSVAAARDVAPFGSPPAHAWSDDSLSKISLVIRSDREIVSEFLYLLLSQVQVIRLHESECIGNRRSLRPGLPGFGCRSCCQRRRMGLCRFFPARRRTLPAKMQDLYDHIQCCTVTPQHVKDQLKAIQHDLDSDMTSERGNYKEFFDRIWKRLGHSST